MRNALFDTEPGRPPTPQETAVLHDIRDRQLRNLVLIPLTLLAAAGVSLLLPEYVSRAVMGIAIVAIICLRAIASRAQCPRCGQRFHAGWGFIEQACGHCGLSLPH